MKEVQKSTCFPLIFEGFLKPQLPELSLKDIPAFSTAALVIAIIGIVESILCATTYADKHKYSISPNRELVALGKISNFRSNNSLGLANFIGSFFQIFPSFGSLARTALNDGAGSKTQLSGLFAAIVVLFSILFLLPHFAYLPKVRKSLFYSYRNEGGYGCNCCECSYWVTRNTRCNLSF
jgi:MFS superfamily sulfate permease-like transporter